MLVSGCGSRSLITDVSIRPEVISPNADGVDDIAEIKYTLTQQSAITIYLVDQEGSATISVRISAAQRERTAYFSG